MKMNHQLNDSIGFLANLFESAEVSGSEQDYRHILQNSEKLKNALIHQFYSIEDETTQRSFIRNLHARLVWLDDNLPRTIEVDEKENLGEIKNLGDIQKSVILILEDLLIFIWENFSSFCDTSQKMPIKFQVEFFREISEKFEKLSLPETNPDHILFEKVNTAVKNRFKEGQPKITYGLMTYLNNFVREIEKVRDSNREHSFSITLKEVLIAYNFNSLPVVHYLVSTIIEDVEKIEPVKDKIERLYHWQKLINQVPGNPAYAFTDKRDAVNYFLNNWTQEEIRFYEKSLLLFSGVYPGSIPGIANTGFKIETDLSVSQIACVVRLLMECDIFRNDNVRGLLYFLADHIRSKKQENISAESLRLKYYNIEESTREQVRKVLFRLLEKSDLPL